MNTITLEIYLFILSTITRVILKVYSEIEKAYNEIPSQVTLLFRVIFDTFPYRSEPTNQHDLRD